MKTSLVIFLAVTLAACGQSEPPANTTGADMVLTNGRVYTVDEARSWAEAVAISDGRISYVGTSAGAAPLIGSNTTVVDLGGRMLMPAFQDSHIHPIGAGIEASRCNLNDLDSVAGYRSAIGEYAAANPDVEWITGGGWSMSEFGPGGRPSKSIIDELVPDRPVYLSSADGHTGWANSRALEIAGITNDTPNPPDGIIDRDPETGEAIGSLQEGAMRLVTRHIPEDSLQDRISGLRYSIDMLHGYGITSITDAIVNRPELETYEALDERGELDLRVIGSLWWNRNEGIEQLDDLIALREEFDNGGQLRPTTVKIMQDGVMENYTAAMLEPYLVPSGTKGIPMVEPEQLKQAVVAIDAAGFQVHFHAIGTAAVRQSLDAIEEALIENGQNGHRHHISHLQMIHPDDIPRFRELETIANFQPLWAYNDDYVTELTVPFIGEERAQWMYPIKSVQDAGGMIAFGSDWSVSTANPMPQIETAVTRLSATGEDYPVMLPEERIDLESAIVAFTINAAFLNRHEDKTGSIEVGKLADLIVLDQNLFEIDPADISETEVLLTLFGGRVVHGDPSSL
ncbi:MAG: amidohydrolase [Gammaproteobacteria bacterium]|nr:amidohydrolase [Gammaproteobacteria bacterium]